MLYANEIDKTDTVSTLKNFEYHINRLNELGILQVALLPKTLQVGEKVLEEGKHKFRPTEEEKFPNTAFLHNEYLRRLTDNYDLRQYTNQWAGCWDIYDDLVRESFMEFRKTSFYSDYIALPSTDFAKDKELSIILFRFLMNREALVAVIGERSLLWEDDFEQIAQYNFMMLKSLDESTMNEAMTWPIMYDKRQEKDTADMDFARTLLRSTLENRTFADEMIKSRLQGWEFERVALMDILLINMAISELISCPTIPEKVTIDEYIELSKEFSSERSRLFVNGILDKLVMELRKQGKINKTGRGLAVMEEE